MPGTQPVARAVGRVRRCRGGRLLMDEGISIAELLSAPHARRCTARHRSAVIDGSTFDATAYAARCRGSLIWAATCAQTYKLHANVSSSSSGVWEGKACIENSTSASTKGIPAIEAKRATSRNAIT